jgi:hypothetical protein
VGGGGGGGGRGGGPGFETGVLACSVVSAALLVLRVELGGAGGGGGRGGGLSACGAGNCCCMLAAADDTSGTVDSSPDICVQPGRALQIRTMLYARTQFDHKIDNKIF